MYQDRKQVILPLEIKKIPENDPMFKLVEICEKPDYGRLKRKHSIFSILLRTMRKNSATESISNVSDALYLKK